MRVLLLLNSDFGVAGTIGARALPIAEALAQSGEFPRVICRGRGDAAEPCVQEVFPFARVLMQALTALQVYGSARLPTNAVKNALFEWRALRKLRASGASFDVVHAWDCLPELFEHLKNRHPGVCIVQDVPMVLPSALRDLRAMRRANLAVPAHVQRAMALADTLIVPSDFVRRSLVDAGVAGDKIVIVPFGVDVERFQPAMQREWDGTFRAAFAGNVNVRKGVPYLVQAWRELKLPDAELHLYGRVYPEVRKVLRDGRDHGIRVHGMVDPAVELPRHHVYVFPTLMEGSAKSVYEALACGLPVITTENAGSIVRDGLDGFLVPVEDVAALQDRIQFFYKHRDRLAEMALKARERACAFDWASYGRNVVATYGRHDGR